MTTADLARRRRWVALALAVAGAAAAGDAGQPTAGAAPLRAQAFRRLQLLEVLRSSRHSAAVGLKLAELSRAVPDAAVLSRVAYSREPGRWELALGQGSKADAEAILARLVALGACTEPRVTQAAGGVTGTCSVAMKQVQRTLRSATAPHPEDRQHESALRGQLEQAQTELPDVREQDELELQLADLGTKHAVASFAFEVKPPVANGPLDVFKVGLVGTAAFQDAWDLLWDLENLRRVVVIDSFELRQPRLRNGEWVVDLAVMASTYRYRVEEERQDQVATLWIAEALPAGGTTDLGRNPFGPPAPVFAGSTRKLDGSECRQEGAATPVAQLELDALAVAYVAAGASPPCAMLVDDKGGCHEVALNQRVRERSVTRIDAGAVTLTRFRMLPDGHAVRSDVAFKVASKARPPPWFCRGK